MKITTKEDKYHSIFIFFWQDNPNFKAKRLSPISFFTVLKTANIIGFKT